MHESFVSLFPQPRVIEPLAGTLRLASPSGLEVPAAWKPLLAADLDALAARLRSWPEGRMRVTIAQAPLACPMPDQAYELSVSPAGIALQAGSAEGARYGLRTLASLAQAPAIPCCRIRDWPRIARRGVQIDIGRVIERPETVVRLLDHYASFNYNVLQLYLENAFVFPSHPKLARPFAWTLDQAAKVVDAAGRYGIQVIPAIQSLGHCGWITQHPDYAELDELHDAGGKCGVLCPSHPRTLQVVEEMIRDVAPLATAGIIHLGMDESFSIGRCSKCAPLRHEAGEGAIYAQHANRVAALTRAAGKRPGIWGDMFYYYPSDAAALDRDILIFDWYYYTFERLPRVELFNFAEMDTRAIWRQNGLESWGCPASLWTVMMPLGLPEHAVENTKSWARYHAADPAPGIMVTQWELSTSSVDYAPPVEGAIAGLLWNPDTEEPSALFADSCRKLLGEAELAPLIEELGAKRLHGHCDLRWLRAASVADMLTYGDPSHDLAVAVRADELAGEIARFAPGSPQPDLVRSHVTAARWQAYQYRKRARVNEAARLAIDGRCREAADALRPLKDEAGALAEATQALWNKNRYPEDSAPTPARLRNEAGWFAGEVAALEAATAAKPYAGQLTRAVIAVHVINTHPAIPCFSVETSTDGASFKSRCRCYILEFDPHAAHPESDERLTYALPVENPEEARFIRITAFGDGQFTLSGVRLHHGARTWKPRRGDAKGRVTGIAQLLGGGTALMGHPDPKALYYELLAKGDSSQIFSVEHGSATFDRGVALPDTSRSASTSG